MVGVGKPFEPIMAAAMAVLAAAFQLPIQETSGSQGAQATELQFPTSVNMVVIPVQVLEHRGRHVRGLAVADFEVRDSGRVVPIELFELVGDTPLAAEPALVRRGEKSSPLRRTFAIFIDDIGARAAWMDRARRAARRLLDRASPEHDVLLVAPASAIAFSTMLPAGRPELARLIDKIALRPWSVSTSMEWRQLYQWRLDALVGALGAISGGGPSALVVLGMHLPYNPDGSSRGDYERVLRASRQSNTAIYFLNYMGEQAGMSSVRLPETLVADPRPRQTGSAAPAGRLLVPSRRVVQSGLLEAVAVDTGGLAFRESNDLGPAVDQVADDLRADYLIGFRPAEGKAGYRALEVRARKKGLKVRTRRGYYAPATP